jgi:hypothetical protein
MNEGPCLAHCYECSPLVAALAYACLAYASACVGYLLLTRRAGTPFRDSLDAAQLDLLRTSNVIRTRAFLQALGLSVGVLVLWCPLARSMKK